jgi:hypothetical protein
MEINLLENLGFFELFYFNYAMGKYYGNYWEAFLREFRGNFQKFQRPFFRKF